ncbi:MAG: hypothetical protein HEQ35_02895 [Gloeotrichia echinulata IR180]
MKTRIFGLALLLSLATVLGACEGGGGAPEGGTTSAPTATGEPTDGATTSPSPTATATSTASPTATPTKTP